MRFKKRILLASVLILSLLVFGQGCGKFGAKDPNPNMAALGMGTACLNDIGPQMTNYLQGNVSAADWGKTWDCVNSTMTLFTTFVKGNDPNGYNQADIQALIKTFLLTKTPISDPFVDAVFELKASLFGGNKSVLTLDEINRFIALEVVLKTETTALIPYLVNHKNSPNAATILALSDAIIQMGINISAQLNTNENSMFTTATAKVFAVELGKVLNVSTPIPVSDTPFYTKAKVLLLGGTEDGIEGSAWPLVIKTLTAYAAPMMAYSWSSSANFTQVNESGELLLQVIKRGVTALKQTLAIRAGILPDDLIKDVVSNIPDRFLSFHPAPVKAAINFALDDFVQNILASKTTRAINGPALDALVSLFEYGTHESTHIDNIYALLGRDTVDPGTFKGQADQYSVGLNSTGQAEVARLSCLALGYVGMFPEGSPEIKMDNSKMVHSRNDMVRLNWFNLIARHLLGQYGSVPAGGTPSPCNPAGLMNGTLADVERLVAPYIPLLRALGQLHPTNTDPALKRFNEANMFVFSSNGDSVMDLGETTYYLAFLMSASSLSTRIMNKIAGTATTPGLCPVIGKDDMDLDTYDITCFRTNYYGNYKELWINFPGLVNAYENMLKFYPQKVLILQQSMEISARRLGYSNAPISSYDITAMAVIPHYLEAMVSRFDWNNDQILDLNEVLNGAYPIVKTTLANAAKQTDNSMLQAILTYIVRFGRDPSLSTWDTIHLLAWYVWRPFWTIQADRAALYKVIAVLSKVGTAPAPSTDAVTADVLACSADPTIILSPNFDSCSGDPGDL